MFSLHSVLYYSKWRPLPANILQQPDSDVTLCVNEFFIITIRDDICVKESFRISEFLKLAGMLIEFIYYNRLNMDLYGCVKEYYVITRPLILGQMPILFL